MEEANICNACGEQRPCEHDNDAVNRRRAAAVNKWEPHGVEQALENDAAELEELEGDLEDLINEDEEVEYVKTVSPMPWQRRFDEHLLSNHEELLLKRQRQERHSGMACSEAWEEMEDTKPDLWKYLKQFDLSEQQMIGVCRTFANYLAQRVRIGNASVRSLPDRSRKSSGTRRTADANGRGSKQRKVDIDLVSDE